MSSICKGRYTVHTINKCCLFNKLKAMHYKLILFLSYFFNLYFNIICYFTLILQIENKMLLDEYICIKLTECVYDEIRVIMIFKTIRNALECVSRLCTPM